MTQLSHMYGVGEAQYQMWGGMGTAMFLWSLLWIVLVAALVYGVVRLTRTEANPKKCDSPVEIAKRRYARGDIAKEEYEQLLKDLKD